MTHVSRRNLSPKIRQQIFHSLTFALTDIKTKEKMAIFLDSLLSETEKLMLAKRLTIIYLLAHGVEETEIAEALRVTQATVSRIRLWCKTKGESYKIAVAALDKQKLLEELKMLGLKVAAQLIKNIRFG